MRNFLSNPFKTKSKVERGDISALTGSFVDDYRRDSLENALPDYYGEIRPEIAARLYASDPYINAAVNVIADYMSTVPLKVYTKSGISSPKREVISGYPYRMIKYVNPFQTQTDFIKTIISWLVLTDNAFIAIEPSTTEKGWDKRYTEFSLYPMNPQWVKIVPDPDTHVDVYIYEVNNKKIYFPKENVIHLKGFSPFNTWLGMSNLNSLISDIKIAMFAKNMTSKFYANAATISGILTVEQQLSDDEVRKLKRDFQTQYQGGKNAFRIVVLQKGMEFDIPKNIAVDLNASAVIDNTASTHSMVLGVPLGILTGDAHGEKLIDVEAVFWNKTLIPIGQQIEASFTKFLAWPISTNMSIEFDYKHVAALRLQALDRAKVDAVHITTGLRTPNELRQEQDKEPYTGDLAEFGNTTLPVFEQELQMAISKQASPTGTAPGSEGGRRDQSNTGETRLIDTTGKRSLDFEEILDKDVDKELIDALNKFSSKKNNIN